MASVNRGNTKATHHELRSPSDLCLQDATTCAAGVLCPQDPTTCAAGILCLQDPTFRGPRVLCPQAPTTCAAGVPLSTRPPWSRILSKTRSHSRRPHSWTICAGSSLTETVSRYGWSRDSHLGWSRESYSQYGWSRDSYFGWPKES